MMEKLGIACNQYICDEALDMSLERIQTMGAIWEKAIADGKLLVDDDYQPYDYSAIPASEEGYYDAVLMDIRMPEMDGLEATKRIRALEREDAKTVPIIALTANAFDKDVKRSMQAGLSAHLTKPVEPDRLFKILEDLIK